MADAWGGSWGSAWGDSWGSDAAEEEEVQVLRHAVWKPWPLKRPKKRKKKLPNNTLAAVLALLLEED